MINLDLLMSLSSHLNSTDLLGANVMISNETVNSFGCILENEFSHGFNCINRRVLAITNSIYEHLQLHFNANQWRLVNYLETYIVADGVIEHYLAKLVFRYNFRSQ